MNAYSLVESLESRTLFTATFAIVIEGTDAADRIVVRQSAGQIRVTEGTQTTMFASAGVGRIIIDSQGGNDRVDCKGISIRCVIEGGSGRDTLLGGNAADRIEGGDGNDLLKGFGGADRLEGQANDDVIYGGDGADRLDGGERKDTLFGEAGDDTLIGDDDLWEDRLVGGTGNDRAEVDNTFAVEDSVADDIEDVND